MTLSLEAVRYNWMGYNGTESAEVMMSRWAGESGGMMDFKERFGTLQEIEDRLYIIKLEMGLLPPEELRDIVRQRAQAAREEQERLKQLRQEHENKLAAERRELEDEEARERLQILKEMENALGISGLQEEAFRVGLEEARSQFNPMVLARALKSFLSSKDATFVSYLDGTSHVSIEELNGYNSSIRDRVAREVNGIVALPPSQSFDIKTLQIAETAVNHSRMRYDAARACADSFLLQRLREAERANVEANNTGESIQELKRQLDNAVDQFHTLKEEYNGQARATAERLICARVARSKIPETPKHSSPFPSVESRRSQHDKEVEKTEQVSQNAGELQE